MLDCYGLRTARSERATTPEEAGVVAARIGSAVALKAFGPDIVHKTEVGAVTLGLTGAGATVDAARAMAERVGAAGSTLDGFLVQEMIDQGVEMLVGVAHDPVFGPVVACSAGGTTVELVHDVAVRVTPISDLDASEMVRSLRTFPLLEGFRGAPKADVPRARGGHPAPERPGGRSPIDRGDGLQPRDGPAARCRGRRRAGPRAGGLT